MLGYISYSDVLEFGVSENTLKNALLNFRKGRSKSWENIKDFTDKRKVWIKLDTIPKTTIKKYSIPTFEAFQLKRKQQENNKYNLLSQPESLRLILAYREAYGEFYQLYWDRLKYSENNQLKFAKQYAQEHSYWVQMVHVTGTLEKPTYGKVKECFNLHKALLKTEIKLQSNINSLVRFKVKLKAIRKALYMGEDAVDHIIHNGFKERKEGTKIKDFHKALIMAYLQYEQIYPYRVVADLVNHHCELKGFQTISESSIKQLMSSDNKFRTLVDAYRYGKKHFNDTLLPHAVRDVTKFPGNVWMIDGTPIQFYCWNESRTKMIRLYLFAIIDVCSRKIVGFDIGYSENRFNILNALKIAVMSEGYLPSEIVSDNFSAGKTEEIMDLKEQMTRLSIKWRNSKVGNSQENSYIERFWGVFQSIECALLEGYIGEGITSKRNNRPNREFVQKMAKKKGLLGVNEMKSQIASMIVKYNERNISGRKSPNQICNEVPKPNAIEMDSVKTALMFWSKTSHTVKRGMVKIKVNKIQYTYEIACNETKLLLQNKKVAVRYNEKDLDWIMLFDYKTDQPICECKKSINIQLASVDQTEDETLKIMKSEAKKKSYVKHIENEVKTMFDKGLIEADLDKIELTHPLSLQKNQVNSKESLELLDMYYTENSITQAQEFKQKNKAIGVIERSDIKDAHKQLLVKKSSVKSSLKPI